MPGKSNTTWLVIHAGHYSEQHYLSVKERDVIYLNDSAALLPGRLRVVILVIWGPDQ